MTKELQPLEVKQLIDADIYLDTKQAAIFLNLSPRTLEKYRLVGGGPSFIKYARAVRYPSKELMNWRDKRLSNNTADYSSSKIK